MNGRNQNVKLELKCFLVWSLDKHREEFLPNHRNIYDNAHQPFQTNILLEKVFSKLSLKIGEQFIQTNKKQSSVLHYKNNIYYFILQF